MIEVCQKARSPAKASAGGEQQRAACRECAGPSRRSALETDREATARAPQARRARTRSRSARPRRRARRSATVRCRRRRRAARRARGSWPAHGKGLRVRPLLLQVVPALERGLVAPARELHLLLEHRLPAEVLRRRPGAARRRCRCARLPAARCPGRGALRRPAARSRRRARLHRPCQARSCGSGPSSRSTMASAARTTTSTSSGTSGKIFWTCRHRASFTSGCTASTR